ncbi:hypothetical protein BD779DRAFT_1677202 [Infundibulicybe gibba]|nr:hypothetical protein BD779DRAFT_1677202 [Infundibulicybe gibba]
MLFSVGFAALILPIVVLVQAVTPGVITVGSFQVKVETIRASPSLLATAKSDGNSTAGTSLTKRTVNNGCWNGCSRTCTNALSSLPTPPTSGDCSALQSAIQALAVSEQAPPFPCNLPNQPGCPNFIVSPGFERTYSIGTCLVGFVNLNPTGGPDVSYCDYLMAGVMPGMYSNCITTAGNTGGYCAQTLQTGSLYLIESPSARDGVHLSLRAERIQGKMERLEQRMQERLLRAKQKAQELKEAAQPRAVQKARAEPIACGSKPGDDPT